MELGTLIKFNITLFLSLTFYFPTLAYCDDDAESKALREARQFYGVYKVGLITRRLGK